MEGKAAPNPCKLFIGQIGVAATHEQIKQVFSQFGNVTEVKILKDLQTGKPRGCGFVAFETPESANAAAETLHEKFIFPGSKREIIVRPAGQKPPNEGGSASHSSAGGGSGGGSSSSGSGLGENDCKLYVGMLSRKSTDQEVKDIFSQFGTVVNVFLMKDMTTGTSKGCAFVTFSSRGEAERAMSSLNGTYKDKDSPSTLQVRPAHNKEERDRHLQTKGVLSKTAGHGPAMGMGMGMGMPGMGMAGMGMGMMGASSTLASMQAAPMMPPGAAGGAAAAGMFSPYGSMVGGMPGGYGQPYMSAPGGASPYSPYGASPYGMMGMGMGMSMGMDPTTGQYQYYAVPPGVATTSPSQPSAGGASAGAAGAGGVDASYAAAYGVAAAATSGAAAAPSAGAGAGASGEALGNRAMAGRGATGCNLFVFHLPENLGDSELSQLFSSYGTILGCKVARDSATTRTKGYGFVTYDSPASAEAAIQALNGFVMGTKRLSVRHKSAEGARGSMPY